MDIAYIIIKINYSLNSPFSFVRNNKIIFLSNKIMLNLIQKKYISFKKSLIYLEEDLIEP